LSVDIFWISFYIVNGSKTATEKGNRSNRRLSFDAFARFRVPVVCVGVVAVFAIVFYVKTKRAIFQVSHSITSHTWGATNLNFEPTTATLKNYMLSENRKKKKGFCV
jgi:hypothetical protein